MPRLNASQRERRDEFRGFVAREVIPHSAQWDRDQRIPPAFIGKIGSLGYLGCSAPAEFGGRAWDFVTFGLLNEAFGRAMSALADVFTVQTMVTTALAKWGTPEQKRAWLPPLARGETIGAFALTEPGAGSATQSVAATLEPAAGGFLLNGRKKWITAAQFAGVFLVFAKLDGKSLACLAPSASPGLAVEPITDLMGFRAAGLGEVRFRNVEIPSANVLGRPGFALSHIAPMSLHYGRLSTACSALGLLRGCFEETVAYAAERRIGERTAGELGMVRTLIAKMGADLEAASGLCHEACAAVQESEPEAFEKTLIAKYFTSRAAVRAASDAVQVHGAAGCHASSAVSRYYRDAKILEIIEGTTQIHEDILGRIFAERGRKPSIQRDLAHEPSRVREDLAVQPH